MFESGDTLSIKNFNKTLKKFTLEDVKILKSQLEFFKKGSRGFPLASAEVNKNGKAICGHKGRHWQD